MYFFSIPLYSTTGCGVASRRGDDGIIDALRTEAAAKDSARGLSNGSTVALRGTWCCSVDADARP